HRSSLCKYPGLSSLVVLVVQVHNHYNCHSHRTWNSCIDLDFASVLLQCSLYQVRHNPQNLGNGTYSYVFLFSMLESQNDLHTLQLKASYTLLLSAVSLYQDDLIEFHQSLFLQRLLACKNASWPSVVRNFSQIPYALQSAYSLNTVYVYAFPQLLGKSYPDF